LNGPESEESGSNPDVGVEPENAIETIVVTGSRIRRTNESAAIPVQILDRGDLDEIGSIDIAEMLQEIPGVDADLSPENTSLSTQNSGLSTVNLRRLGGNRTLTLIDGRRAVSNSGNGERVNLNTIPAGFVQSIEVTTGGASAIYGSDAIAGVVNVLLKDDFEGFEVHARQSNAEASGERERTIDLTFGTRFANGRGYLLAGATYDDETAIFADATRPQSILPIEFDEPNRSRIDGQEDNPDAFGSELGFGNCDASGDFCMNPALSSNLPGGLFEGDDAWNIGGVWFNDQSLLPNDGRQASFGFETEIDGINFRPGRTLSPSSEVITAAIKTEFSLTPDVAVFFDVSYSEIETLSRNAALNATSGTDIGNAALQAANPALIFEDIGRMAADHLFIPPEVEETRSGTVSWRRRFVEVGTRDRFNQRDTLRTAFGLEGNAWDDWEWTAYGTYGEFDQRQTYVNELNFLNLQRALNIEADGSGGFQCDDAGARADGCVPLNIFGEGSITPEAANYIRYTGQLRQERTQTTFAGNMNGELLQMAAGPMSAAFGFEYRREEQDTLGDPDNAFEYTSVTPVPNISADFDVIEVFAEVDIPLVTDKLSLQLAARAADYSTVGNTFSYNIGGSWQPIPDIRFRGQYSRSQRAPTLTEFFSPPRGDFDGLLDPCDGLFPDGTGITPPPGSTTDPAVIAANCLAAGPLSVQPFFDDPDNAGSAYNFAGSVSGPNAGNDMLQEETADTYTVGVVFTPRSWPNLTLIVDYYDILVVDAIGSVSTQLTADLCFGAADFPNNRFCDVISRDTSTGFVQQVVNRQENLNELTAEGIDATVNYEGVIGALPGEFGLNVRYTHYLTDDFTFVGIDGPQLEDSLGEIGETENEYRARIRWDWRGLRLSWSARYRDGGVDDLRVAADDPAFFRASGETFHSFFVRYELRDNPRVRFYAGINNVTDEMGPIIPIGLNNGNSRNIVSSLNDVEGREFYAGVRMSW